MLHKKFITFLILILEVFIISESTYSQGQNIELIDSLSISYCQDATMSDIYAYIAAGDSGLYTVFISSPSNLIILGHLNISGSAKSIAISDNYAYIAAYQGGLRIIDIINPYNPIEVGYYNTQYESYLDVTVVGNYAYVALGFAGIRILNISNPSNPIEVGCFDTQNCANRVIVIGNLAYVADGSAGLGIYNVFDPANPIEIGYCDTQDAKDIKVIGSYAYIADGWAGLKIVDICNPNNPAIVGQYYTSGYSIDVYGDFAFFISTSELIIVNISDPSNIVEVGYYNTPGYPQNVTFYNNYAFVSDWYYFDIFDCSTALPVDDHSFIPYPSSFILSPAPNPFNSSTTISFALPSTNLVSLDIFDITGREVARLVDDIKPAGSYSVTWNADEYSSGVYLVQLTSGKSSQTRKLLLIK